ncbi:transcriptional regulator, HxlR family [Amycolatopsis marina]|uniref:Transcriptional regulator, HxlR family n=1 Tax=Amycolatopsis marina TaxID=490629 RepID=A0A1I0ZHW2_9PSEU|nr:helix-turn-helix domain-containing protein [Amycolatopsis marina]SFB25235.1 transcriptional regulator, HxlR family [Amycolatopsis marina]
MTGRTYGQYCGLARALELVGERWAMLVVRDLLLGPKRYADLRETLYRIPPSMLSARLNELEQAGVVRRRVLANLDAAVVYELTDYGSELETIVLQLGLWGARSLGDMAEDDIFTLDSAVLSLYTTFRPDMAVGFRATYQVHYGPSIVVHAMVDDGALKAAEGAHPDADVVIDVLGPFKAVLTGALSPREASDAGLIRVSGDLDLLDRFGDLFRIPPAPVPTEGLVVR